MKEDQNSSPLPHGIHKLSDSDYFALPQISNSALSLLAKSPLNYRYWIGKGRSKTKAMELGSATHCAVLEPEEFTKRYACAPEVDRRTSVGKMAYAKWLEENAGRTPLDVSDFEMVVGMMAAVRKHRVASWLLREGEAEQSIIWTDQETGVGCRAKADWLDQTNHMMVDLKTTECARPDAFVKSIIHYGYQRQAAFYSDGYEAVTGRKPKFAFIAVEKGSPYHLSTLVPSEKMLAAGRAEYKALLRTFAECRRTDVWPGYEEVFQEIDLPSWYSRAG